MGMKQWWRLLKAATSSWSEDFAPSMGAALSYYMLFSIAPLLVIVIAVAGFFFGAEAVRGEVFAQLSGLMGQQGAATIEALLKSASEPKEGTIATAASVAVLLLGSTTALAELQSDLDRIWRAPALGHIGGMWKFIRVRLFSFAMILSLAFLLMVSLVLSAAMAALGKWWEPWFAGWETLAHTGRDGGSIAASRRPPLRLRSVNERVRDSFGPTASAAAAPRSACESGQATSTGG